MAMSQENLPAIYTASDLQLLLHRAAQTDPKTSWGLLLKGARVRYFIGGVVNVPLG